MIIYTITNLVNNKMYVGLTTVTLDRRWREHTYRSSSCSAIHRAIKKYGKDNFEIKVIDTAESISELKEKEAYWIAKLNTLAPNGYNLTTGGEHPLWSDASKQKLSRTETGRVLSEEHKQKIREANKGTKPSLSARLASSKAVVCVETNVVYQSITEAAKAVGGNMKAISYCLHKGENRTSGGYHWRWVT